jgi:hypothetical protein
MPVIIMSNGINHYGALSTAVVATRGYKVTRYAIFPGDLMVHGRRRVLNIS